MVPLRNHFLNIYRGVAQFGRALRSGRRGRGFESRRLDAKTLGFSGVFFCCIWCCIILLHSYINSHSRLIFIEQNPSIAFFQPSLSYIIVYTIFNRVSLDSFVLPDKRTKGFLIYKQKKISNL